MKFIAIGDLHYSLYGQDPIVAETNLPERLHYLCEVMDNIALYAKENNINKIIVAGDTLHNKSIIHTVAMSVLLDFLRTNSNIEFILVDGNHDMSSKSGNGVSALKSLDTEPNVTVIHKSVQIENILFVPWNSDMIDNIKNGKSEYLIAHLGLNEAQLSSGISIVSEIGLSSLKQYKTCILGHYHKPQEVGNCIYVGSPIQLDWGEKNEEKRFLVVDTDKHTIESIPTIGYKKHYELEITKDNKDSIIESAKKLKNEGHFVNIKKKTNVDTDDIQEEFRVIDKTEKNIINRGITMLMSDSDKLMKYMEIKEIKKEDQKDYLKEALNLINMED